MVQKLATNHRSVVLDFTSKKVRCNGKCLTKFQIAYLIDDIKPHFNAKILYDVYSYQDLKDFLKNFASDRLSTIYGECITIID